MMRRMCRLAGILALVLSFSSIEAQHASETYGRNRIQYKSFDWKYLSSENFDVYFYGERRKLAKEALQYLESEFDRITDLLGFYPYQKTKVFLYNSIVDLQQSNVGLAHTRYIVSGETEFVKPYVEIAHPGNLEEFKDELVFKMSNLLVNEMMFGGSLREMFTSSVLLNLPDWFIDGTSYYVAYGWNDEMDDYVRQLVKGKNINKALRKKDREAALVGQSIWNYIVEKYGKSSINNILNYTRIIRNEEKSILITLGVPFKQLMLEWRDYYMAQEKRVSASYAPLSDSLQFTDQKHHLVTYTTVKISPDGKSIAYAENDRGKFTVKVKSLENGKETIIIEGGNRVIKQTVDYRVPLLSWADANTLGVIGVKSGQYIFWLYDLKTRTKLPRELDKFSNIRSFSFSNNGRLVILSADFEGQNDLFLLSSRRDRTKRLTNDTYDDLDPAFIPNSNTIVFSSNRVTDSLTTDVKAFQKLSPYYNLFLFNIDTTTNRLKR
ncbi:MAG TPA: translocation protein TolB, partial [Cyclobacteriaceae bacterium]|nr:translocation protein TolB [Cyclobacteriaceae bacterium]